MGSYPASEYVSGHIGLRSFHWHTRNLSDRCKKLLIFFYSQISAFCSLGRQTRTKRISKRTDFFKIERCIEIYICLLPLVRQSDMFC